MTGADETTQAMTPNDESDCYQVVADGDKYEIRNDSGRTVLVFTDERSARHQAQMLNEAYRAGFRAGARASRSRGVPRGSAR